MIAYLLISLASTQAVPAPPASAAVLDQNASTPLLWRDLRVGMTPEQTADALRQIEGITEVTVRRNRRQKFQSLRIKHAPTGVVVGDMKFEVAPTFDGERLTEITLTSEACAAAGNEQIKLLRSALQDRYERTARERVVDENGVEFQQRAAFWNSETRVRLSYELKSPSSDYYGSGTGVQGALAGLANMMSQASRDAALQACPNDAGVSVATSVNYSSQAVFLAEQAGDAEARQKRARSTRDGL